MNVAELVTERGRQLDIIKEAKAARTRVGLLNKLIAQYGALEGDDIPRIGRRTTKAAAARKPRRYPKVEPDTRGMYRCPQKGCPQKYPRPQELSLHRLHTHKAA